MTNEVFRELAKSEIICSYIAIQGTGNEFDKVSGARQSEGSDRVGGFFEHLNRIFRYRSAAQLRAQPR